MIIGNLVPSSQRVVAICLVASAAVLVTACSSKPPACGDSKTTTLARGVVSDAVASIFPRLLEAVKQSPDHVTALKEVKPEVDKYVAAVKVDLREVVSNGYSDDARKYTCAGVFVVTVPTGQTFTASRTFTSQATADGKGEFIVKVENVEGFMEAVGSDLGDVINTAATAKQQSKATAEPTKQQKSEACYTQRMAAWDVENAARIDSEKKAAVAQGKAFDPPSAEEAEEARRSVRSLVVEQCG